MIDFVAGFVMITSTHIIPALQLYALRLGLSYMLQFPEHRHILKHHSQDSPILRLNTKLPVLLIQTFKLTKGRIVTIMYLDRF